MTQMSIFHRYSPAYVMHGITSTVSFANVHQNHLLLSYPFLFSTLEYRHNVINVQMPSLASHFSSPIGIGQKRCLAKNYATLKGLFQQTRRGKFLSSWLLRTFFHNKSLCCCLCWPIIIIILLWSCRPGCRRYGLLCDFLCFAGLLYWTAFADLPRNLLRGTRSTNGHFWLLCRYFSLCFQGRR